MLTCISDLFREGSSSSSALPELNPRKATKENEDLNGDFLTLAPPKMVVPRPSSKSRHPLMFLNPHGQELPDFESLPFQVRTNNINALPNFRIPDFIPAGFGVTLIVYLCYVLREVLQAQLTN